MENFYTLFFLYSILNVKSLHYSKTSFIGTPLKCKHLVYRDLEGLPTTTYSLMVGCHDSCCMLTFSNGNEGIYNTKVCKKIDIIKLLQMKHLQTMSLYVQGVVAGGETKCPDK